VSAERFDPAPVLAGLKDFQRRTVEHAFRRLYLDDPPGRRFLVADEVGLGKTLVARGVIAKTLEHLHDQVDRIDIVYICSNAAIAGQNVNRLNVVGEENMAIATRLTLLPTQIHDLASRRVNFVSFTPGTALDLRSRGGLRRERAVICKLLEDEELVPRRGLWNLLQNQVARKPWRRLLREWDEPLDEDIRRRFVRRVKRNRRLRRELERLADFFSDLRRSCPREIQQDRLALIGQLRHELASLCVDALEPDLVILDEFQRFRDLLDSESEAAELARVLFEYPDVRVLLLSATPYKMLSLDHEEEDDHYRDFERTLEFLYKDSAEVAATREGIQRYRRALYALNDGGGGDHVARARDALQARLCRVISRTERVGMTARRDAMLAEPPQPAMPAPPDLRQARLADAVSRALGAPDPIEYWKSSPYLLSFMRHYKLRERLEESLPQPPKEVVAAMADGDEGLLRRGMLDEYGALEPANARMRCLFRDTLDRGLWQLLWMPPSMPYLEPAGPYAEAGEVTKSLVFSSWTLVPDAIATLVSYEAERRMVQGLERALARSRLYDELRSLLRFTRDSEGRLTGMPALVRTYPSPALATLVDPLALALAHGGGGPVAMDEMLALAEARLRPRLAGLTRDHVPTAREDERWYWAAPALLDRGDWPGVAAWCVRPDAWTSAGGVHHDELGAGFREHVQELARALAGKLDPPLGTPPADLLRVLAELALGGPGVCVLRALRRIAPGLAPDAPPLLSAAASGASGFRTLFNLPETIALLRARDPHTPYWRLALHYALEGNLQALLDEQVHVLQESLGLIDAAPERRVQETARALGEALSIRTAQVRVEEYEVKPGGRFLRPGHFNVRARFALRFGELKDDREETLARVDTVRTAFNSPFRPFVLASTSVGQEGLDFHTWCHAVVHWNLPSNPVDLEQREGRVHRFKGHAVRKNLARAYGLPALEARGLDGADPWTALFEMAAQARLPGTSDLVPYWVFEAEGGARIERRVPLIPYSREVEQLARLKRGVALYRLVFGQPRQEDLLAYVSRALPEGQVEELVRAWRIDLAPSDTPMANGLAKLPPSPGEAEER